MTHNRYIELDKNGDKIYIYIRIYVIFDFSI